MNTYRSLPTEAGDWVVGWWVDGIWKGPVWGTFVTEAEAAFCAYSLARMELEDAQTEKRFGGAVSPNARKEAIRARMTEIVTHAEFGAGQAGVTCLAAGWSEPEQGFTWSVDDQSVLSLPIAQVGIDLEIHLTLMPLTAKPFRPAQRLGVEVNGLAVGLEFLSGPTVVGYRVGASVAGRSGALHVRLIHPDSFSLAEIGDASETRRLAFALWEAVVIKAAPETNYVAVKLPGAAHRRPINVQHFVGSAVATTGVALADMASAFESLGTNCEFGLFQRRCGSESLGLLRFAGLPYPSLVSGLDLGFPDIEEESLLRCTIEGATPEWMVEHTSFNMKFHTFASPLQVSQEMVIRQQGKVLPYRRDRLLEILETGEKVFVVLRPEGLTLSQVRPLLSVLRSYGPNSLLYVSDTTGHPAGTVQQIEADLYCGSMDGVDKVAPKEELIGRDTWLSDASFAAWSEICASTYKLWKRL